MASLKYGEIWAGKDVRRVLREVVTAAHPRSKSATVEAKVEELMGDAERTFDPDEPVFVLRGRDPASWETLKAYVSACEERGAQVEHQAEVLNVAASMAQWQRAHPESVKVAD